MGLTESSQIERNLGIYYMPQPSILDLYKKNHNTVAFYDQSESDEYGDQEAKTFALTLENQGHKCVNLGETTPIQVSWCKQNKCIYT